MRAIAMIVIVLFGGASCSHEPNNASSRPARQRLTFRLVASPGHEADPGVQRLPAVNPTPGTEAISVMDEVLLDGTAVESIAEVPAKQSAEQPVITLHMTAAGARRLRQITEANIGRRLAIILDDKVLIAPVIRDAISGDVSITLGELSEEELSKLVATMRAAVDSGRK